MQKQIYRDKCVCCGNTHLLEVTGTGGKTREGSVLRLVSCQSCGLLFNSYISEINYAEYNRTKREPPLESFKKRTSPNAFCWRRFRWVLESIRKEQLTLPKRVYEIGTSDGANLYPWMLLGSYCAGADFDEEYLKPGRKLGMILKTELDCQQNFDLVIISHVLEHIDDIATFFKDLKRLATTDTLFYFEVPGLRSWLRPSSHPRLVWDGIRSSDDPTPFFIDEHVSYFSKQTLSTCLELHGFQVLIIDEYCRALVVCNHIKPSTIPQINSTFTSMDDAGYVTKVYKSWRYSWKRIFRSFLKTVKVFIYPIVRIFKSSECR